MAIIPVGNAGYRVASGAPHRVGAAPSLGEGLAAVGQAGMQAGALAREHEDAQSREVMQAEHREAAAVESARQDRARLDASTRVMVADEDLLDAQTENARRLLAGELDEVGYIGEMRSALDRVRNAALDGVDPKYAPTIEKNFVKSERQLSRAMRGTLADAEKKAVGAEVSKALEVLQRQALREPGAAVSRADQVYDAAQGILGAEAVAKGKAAFRERAWRSHYLRAIEAGRNSPQALNDLRTRISSTDALDPNQQTALLTSIDTRQQLLENRARVAAEKRDRQARQAFEALQSLDAQGLPADPAYLSDTMAKLKGTAYEAAARQIVEGSVDTARFGALPVPEQDRVLQALFTEAAKTGVDPAKSKRLSKLAGARNAKESAFRDDPWRAAVEYGALDAPPAGLDMSSPDTMARSLRDRMAQAETVDVQAGRQVSPLRKDEARMLGDMLSRMPIPERVRFLGGIGKVIGGRRLEDLSKQLGSDNDELGVAAAMEALEFKRPDGRSVAEIYLEGADAMKTGRVKSGAVDVQDALSRIRKEIGDAYTTPQARDTAVDVAMKIWAQAEAAGGSMKAVSAVRLATGGIVERNGRKVPIPHGWSDDEFDRAVRNIDGDAVRAAAGGEYVVIGPVQTVAAESFAHAIPSAQLRSAGPNRYAVQIGNQLVTRPDGTVFTINLVRP